MLRKLFAILLCCLLPLCALAEEQCGCFTYEKRPDGSLSITSCSDDTSRVMEVPDKLDDMPVRCIGDYAFAYAQMEEVIIPEGVTDIGACAFNACYSLKEVHLPQSLETIGADAFLCCVSLEEITFPKGLKSIGDEAFYNCQSLKKADVPAGTRLGVRVFEACDRLGLSEP